MDKRYQDNIQKLANAIIADGYKSICFWMPCYNVSGGARYLRDLAVVISKYTSLKVYYVDFENGFPSSMLQDSPQVSIIKFNPQDTEFPIKEPTIIFTNSTKVIQIKKMNPKSKILFWHFETIPCAWNWLFFNNEEKRFIKLTKDTHAMIYHDWSGRDILSDQFQINFDNKDYLQVYSALYNNSDVQKPYKENEINIVWLSRLGAEKVCSLYNILDNFAKFKTNKIKRIHIIGDGIRREEVEAYCKKYKDRLEMIFTGTIPHEELSDYLLKNADIVFAMGTSVVESAALKIPSVVVQLSSKRFNDDAYYWLYDAKEYCVGITTDEKKRYNVPYKKMEDLLNAIDSQEKRDHIGEKCYNYFVENHYDFYNITEKFLTFALNTKLTYRMLRKVIKFTPYNIIEQTDLSIKKCQLYSKVKFANRVYIRILGIPIINFLIDSEFNYAKWGLWNLKPIFFKVFRKKYKSPDNESVNERLVKIGKRVLFRIVKDKSQTKYYMFGKQNVLTKRENIGYTFPQSLFRG